MFFKCKVQFLCSFAAGSVIFGWRVIKLAVLESARHLLSAFAQQWSPYKLSCVWMFHSLNTFPNVTLSTYPGLKSAVEVHQLEALLTSQIIMNYYLFQTQYVSGLLVNAAFFFFLKHLKQVICQSHLITRLPMVHKGWNRSQFSAMHEASASSIIVGKKLYNKIQK